MYLLFSRKLFLRGLRQIYSADVQHSSVLLESAVYLVSWCYQTTSPESGWGILRDVSRGDIEDLSIALEAEPEHY
jgi:hypothetical protein